MDYEMESVDTTGSKDVLDKSIDVEWQIDSEWINLSSVTSSIQPAGARRGRQTKHEVGYNAVGTTPSFHFIPATKGGRFLVMDDQALRLSQKKASGYSYWVCSIPCCTARCLLDPEEKKIVRFCREHNHEVDVSRQEYKKFINALKTAVRENPHVKPKTLYDAELEKAKERWRESNLKLNTNEEEPNLPSFDAVRTAMYNSRNAVLSAVSLKATGDDAHATETEVAPSAGPSRSTRSRDAKINPKRKSTPSKTLLSSTSDLDELEEEWSNQPHKDANLSDLEEWLDDDVNANIPAIVTPTKQPRKVASSPSKRTPVKNAQDVNLNLSENDEEEEDDDSDTDWKDTSPSSKSGNKQNAEDVNFYFMPSSRGCQVLVIDGCLLHQNTIRGSGKSYWRCQKKSCFFRAVYDPRQEKVTKTTGLHNHAPDSNQMMRRQFINNVKYQITEHPHVPAKQIYDKEVLRMQQELAELGIIWKIPPFSCVKHHAYRARRIATKSEEGDEEEEEMNEEQMIKREITETEKKFLEESAPAAQEEDSGLNVSLLSSGPAPIQSRNFPDLSFYFIPSKKGKRILVVNDFTFRLNSLKSGGRYYWKCTVDPCMFRCVYNENLKDLVKVSGKHTHASNVHRLRTREFCFLMKARMAEDPTLTPKKAYDQEVAKIRSLENGESLVKCIPAYSSIRTSLYNQKHKRAMEDEQGLMPGTISAVASTSGYNNYCMTSSVSSNFTDSSQSGTNVDQAQDISPKDITHLSLEDNDPMDHDEEDRGASSSSASNNNPMEIAAPSLYDNHDIIDKYCGLPTKAKEESSGENQVITMPDPSTYSLSFVPTTRGGRALVVNGCVLRISYTRDFVTYWRCLNNECAFRCSYDSKGKKLLRISGEHNHPVNRYSPIIRTFVRKVKKRVCQENDLSPKIIYDEELERLKVDWKDVDLFKRLPSYDSMKSTLYKVKNKYVRASTSVEETADFMSEDSDEEKEEESFTETTPVDDPPDDPVIEEGFASFNTQLPSWLEQDPDKRILDGHLLVKKSSTETSTGWACGKDGCPFRCVVDNDTNAITRSQWDHTHKSVIKHTIAQAMFHAVKRRAVMDVNIFPKVIYEQERKRIIDKLSGNKILIKFIPNLTQVYQLVTKTRANPPPPPKPKVVKVKPPKQPKKKKSRKSSGGNNSTSSGTSNNSGGNSQYETDYLLDHCDDDGERVHAYVEQHQQQQQQIQNSLIFEQNPSNVLSGSMMDNNNYNNVYPQSSFASVGHSYTNIIPPQTNSLHTNAFNSVDRQLGFGSFSTSSTKPTHYPSTHSFLHHQHQQQPQQHQPVAPALPPHQQQPLPITIPPNISTQPPALTSVPQQQGPMAASQPLLPPTHTQTLSPNNENVFTLHGYPLFPAMTQMGNIYWQCRVPGCRFQCVLNAGTSQLVQISGNHNHEPPDSQSAFCSQVVKMLQRKAAENLDEPLTNVYWEYMKNLRNVIDCEEILSGLPRFQDVAVAMQSARSAMGADDSSQQLQNLVTGNATQTNKVFEFHFDPHSGSLVVNGDSLVHNWRMNEISYWRCKRVDCRFKCTLDDELQCVHIMHPHTHPCPASTQDDDRNGTMKRKYPDKPPPRRPKFQRID